MHAVNGIFGLRTLCGGSDLLISHRFRSCICALILEGGGVTANAENSASSRVSREP